MILQDLQYAKNIRLQIVWGDQVVEVHTEVIDTDKDGIFTTPYIHNGEPLVLDIDTQHGVICNIFADNPVESGRISWRNIELHTVQKNGETAYYLKTSAFNELANNEDRRDEERIVIMKKATLHNEDFLEHTDIIIHDISNKGLGFYAPKTFVPKTSFMSISFVDRLNDHEFAINVKCKMVRTKNQAGNVLYGCKLLEENKDYLLYGCISRMMKNAKVRDL